MAGAQGTLVSSHAAPSEQESHLLLPLGAGTPACVLVSSFFSFQPFSQASWVQAKRSRENQFSGLWDGSDSKPVPQGVNGLMAP